MYLGEAFGDLAIQLCQEFNELLLPFALGGMTPPGMRHRVVGRMTILNVVPPFDPADQSFD
jgi:hypothetical protein